MSVAVLHVAETLAGGIASYFDEMLPVQRDALGDKQVQVLVPRSQLAHVASQAENQALTYRDVSVRPLRVITLAWALMWVLWRQNPAIVHAHSTIAGVVVRLCCALLPRQRPVVIYCAHGWAWDRECGNLQRTLIVWMEKILSHLTDQIICISQHDLRSATARGLAKRKLTLISNGIAPSAASAPVAAPRDFIFVGRFDRQKGVDLFLEAMRRMGDKATAYAVGDSVLGSDGLGEWPSNTQATGWLARDKVAGYLGSVKAVVMPSRWEGFGLVALEAMRAGRPVIAARVGGLQELIVDGTTGFLFEPNSPDALVHAMERALASDLNAMGRAARERFHELYTSDRMNRDLLALYDSLTACARAPQT